MTLPVKSDDPISGWCIMHSGMKLDMNFLPEQIRIEDIAQGLSKMDRWGRQGNEFYSVAQHSVLIYEVMRRDFKDQPMWALWALLHDGAEAFIGDMARPFKQYMPDYLQMEALLLQAIAEKFDLAPDIPLEVLRADHNIVYDEAIVLFSHLSDRDMDWLKEGNYLGVGAIVAPWEWREARKAWLSALRHSLARCSLIDHWNEEFGNVNS